MTKVTLTVDHDADAAYLRLSDSAVVRTVEACPGILIDLDALDIAVGVEVLELDVEIPFEKLEREFHIPSTSVGALRMVSPTVTTFEARMCPGTAITTPSEAHRRTLLPC